MTIDGGSLRAARAQFDEAQKTPRGSSLGNPPHGVGILFSTLMRQTSGTIHLPGPFLNRLG